MNTALCLKLNSIKSPLILSLGWEKCNLNSNQGITPSPSHHASGLDRGDGGLHLVWTDQVYLCDGSLFYDFRAAEWNNEF